jgi:arylsulfatase
MFRIVLAAVLVAGALFCALWAVQIGLTRRGRRLSLTPGAAQSGRPGETPFGVRRIGAGDVTVVLVVIDTLRADHLSCYGYARGTSPNIDRLAADAVVFENNKAQSSHTVTSMASMFQSKYTLAGSLPPARGEGGATVAEVMQAAGYHTVGVQTNPWLKRRLGYARGFDDYRMLAAEGSEKKLPSRKWTREATGNVFYADADEVAGVVERVIESREKKPLFLYVHLMDPHGPYIPPPEYQRFAEGALALSEAAGLSGDWVSLARGDDPTAAPPLKERILALYDAEILFADAAVGRMIAALEKAGLYEGALVILAADHGEGFLEHRKVLHSNSLYEELIHTPLVMRIPGRAAGRYEGLARNVDIAATIFEVAGIEAVWDDRDGVSLLEVLGGGRRITESLAQLSRGGGGDLDGDYGSLQAGVMKYIATRKPDRPFLEELYNLETDPREASNLAASEATVARALAGALSARAGAETPGEAPALDEETAAALRALGYLQ